MIGIINMCARGLVLSKNEFLDPIASAIGDSCKAEVYHRTEIQQAIKRAEGIILTGTPLKDFEFMKDDTLLNAISSIQIPVLGICAGMQVIAQSLGAKSYECMELGMTSISTTAENPLFTGDFKAYSMHKLAIDIPDGFIQTAKSDMCQQAFWNGKKIFGTLFHPEVRNIEIIEKFIEFASDQS